MSKLVSAVKRVALPPGSMVRRLPRGIGRGIRMDIDFATQTRLFLGFFETELNPHLRRLCRSGVDVFDIGGHVGYDALVTAKLTGGRVLSVDCEAQAIERMRKNFAENPRLERRLTPKMGEVAATSDKGSGRVTLDQLADEHFVPGLVKVDIEGGEVDALRGAPALLGRGTVSWVIEVHSKDREERCLELLLDSGYEPQIVDQRRFLPDHRVLPHNRWLIAEAPALR